MTRGLDFSCLKANVDDDDERGRHPDDGGGPSSSSYKVHPTEAVKDHEELLKILQSGKTTDIVERLENVNLGETFNDRSIFHSVITTATNGDQLVRHKLDECVTETCDSDDDPSQALEVSFRHLFGTAEEINQTVFLKDLLKFRHENALELLKHPVIETYLVAKWKKIRSFFFFNFIIYCLFLMAYSMFLGNIFYRKENKELKLTDIFTFKSDRIVFPGSDAEFLKPLNAKREDLMNKTYHPTFHGCSYEFGPTYSCFLEWVIVITITLLFMQEVFQCYALGFRNYVRELENFLELLVIALVVTSLSVQGDMLKLKLISAIAVTVAYVELIFLMGRFPFLGGTISLMFYSITRHMFKTLINFCILLIGFAFAFFIMHHNQESDHFENPGKAFLKTLTMVLGEFEFNDLYANNSTEDVSALIFTMILLVALILLGSLVMVNLLVAIIVSDLSELREKSHTQALVNQAQHVIHIESVFNVLSCVLPSFVLRRMNMATEIYVCPHSICRCSSVKLDQHLVAGLRKIVKKRAIMEQVKSLVNPDLGASLNELDAMSNLMRNLAKTFRSRAMAIPNRNNGGSVFADMMEILVDRNL